MQPQQSQQKMVLSDDGELRHLTDEAASPAVFCIHCGTANRGEGHLCRSCGQSLDEQAINPASLDSYRPPQYKNKRAAQTVRAEKTETRREAVPMTAGMVIVELFTLLVMSGLMLAALAMGQGFIGVCILIAWFLVEAARHGALN